MVAVSAAAVTGFAIALTAGAYSLSLLARKRDTSPLTTPVLFSTAVVIAVLMATRDLVRRHCQLSGPRASFAAPLGLERGSKIGEQRTFRPEPPRHRHNEHTTGG